MISRCDTQSLATAWLGKDEPISRAQPIEAKTPGLGAGKRGGFPTIGCNNPSFYLK
jgi:hypothetical protein